MGDPKPWRSRGWSSILTLWMPIVVVALAVVAGYIYPLVSAPSPESSFNSSLIGSSSGKDVYQTAPPAACSCEATRQAGLVDDCCCEYHVVDELNQEELHPILTQLVKKPFFSYFKVRLWCDCPFWPNDGMCHLRDCSVCECTDEEIPPPFKKATNRSTPLKPADDPFCADPSEDPKGIVDRTVNSQKFKKWTEEDNAWTADDESSDEEMVYVNLQLNPERYTGYKGVSARRIWEAIYDENCFQGGLDPECTERRVFYRLISGLHSSITIHLSHNYLLDEEKDRWGPNLEIYHQRIHAFPQRLQNLYFTFLFVLRAATKAADFLAQAEYNTGQEAEDAETLALVRQLVQSKRLSSACPLPFDEGQMWRGEEGPQLRQQMHKHFRNISAIMDCVGCEKCRLWGKLQILGLATSLKILFSESDSQNLQELNLQRNEVIALINTLARFSESLMAAAEMAELLHRQGGEHGVVTGLLFEESSLLERLPSKQAGSLVDALLPS